MASETITLIVQLLLIAVSNPLSDLNIVNTFQNPILIAADPLSLTDPVKNIVKMNLNTSKTTFVRHFIMFYIFLSWTLDECTIWTVQGFIIIIIIDFV
jgi:hypothetical protein